MASTSTSFSDLSRITLRLCERSDRSGGEFDLYDIKSITAGLDVEDGSVIDTGVYDVALLVPKGSAFESAVISVNGDDGVEWRPSRVHRGGEDVWYDVVELLPLMGGAWGTDYRGCLFCLCYGFARVEVAIKLSGKERLLVCTTKDIVCRTKEPYEADNIQGMLTRLLDSNDDLASKWMFSGVRQSYAPFSVLEGAILNNAPKSVSSVILLLRRVLMTFSDNVEYFRSHGYSRVRQERTRVSTSQIQHTGYDELLWISRNPEVLDEVHQSIGIFYGGRNYLPRMVQTRVRRKTYDSYENRLVLGFLAEVVRAATVVRASLRDGAEAVMTLERRLSTLCAGNENQPAMALARLYRMRESSYLEQLDSIVRISGGLLRRYRQFMPGVEGRFSRNPRRTKVFQEVRPYAQIWAALEEWLKFGDFSLAKENLVLHTLRTDKLYEYYVLYELLDWLAARGFRPQASDDRAIRKACFSTANDPDSPYRPEDGVSSVYALSSQSARIILFYQPVIYADGREEEGVTLHRLSRSNPHCPYWTPDYLLEVTLSTGERSYHIIDAKYRRFRALMMGYPKEGEFAECIMKYRQDVGQAHGKGVSTVWLFAGRADKGQVRYAEQSIWAQHNWTAPRSGVAVLAPGVSCLDEYFANMLPSDGMRIGPNTGASVGTEQAGAAEGGIAETPLDEPAEVFPVSASKVSAPVSRPGSKSMVSEGRLETEPTVPKTEGYHSPINASASLIELNRQTSTNVSIDESIMALIEELVKLLPKRELYNARWASSRLLLERPLIRESPPKTSRERQYYRPVTLDGEQVLLYARWRPDQVSRLSNLIRMLRSHAQ